jgi:hypothetical protein
MSGSITANGYGLAKGKIKSTNVQPLHNANKKHKSPMIVQMFAFCQTDVGGWAWFKGLYFDRFKK